MGNKNPVSKKSKNSSRRHQMKKLLIALAAIGSVNAFAANVNIELQNNTACPVSVNGNSYNPGETGHATLDSDGTYAVTEYSSFDDDAVHCKIAAATVLVSFAGNQPSAQDGDSFFLNAIQSSSFSNISSPFGGVLKVDGQSQSLGNNQEAKIKLSAKQSHNAVLTITGSGVIPAGQKPKPVTPDYVYPNTIQATITNNTSCPMVIMGGPTIETGKTARNVTLSATSAILEKMDGPTGKCALSTTAEIYYDHATVTPASDGKVELKQNILENNGSYFKISAVSGNQSGATTSKTAGTFLNHAFSGEVEKNNPAVNITVSTHVNPEPAPQAGVYPEGYPNYKAGDKIKGADGRTYECKPFPASGWCNQAPSVYAPGSGSAWADAWTLAGDNSVGIAGSGHSFW